jgi:hypothetical protein
MIAALVYGFIGGVVGCLYGRHKGYEAGRADATLAHVQGLQGILDSVRGLREHLEKPPAGDAGAGS